MRKDSIKRAIAILENGIGNATAPEEARLRAFCRGMQREPEELFRTAGEAVTGDISAPLRSTARHALRSYDRLTNAAADVIEAAIAVLRNFPAEDDYADAA